MMTEMEMAILRSAYLELLALPRHRALRARMQGILASLRDEIAVGSGKTAEEVQNTYEEFLRNM